MRSFLGLPAWETVEEGLRDLETGVESVPALLVCIGAPRLTRLGLQIPRVFSNPEHRLYALLTTQHREAAHSQYNALIRRLVSFERALECVA